MPITKSTPLATIIDDFVHSDAPQFAGKSKDDRIRMAKGAFYGMQKEDLDESSNDMEDEDAFGHGYRHGGTGHPNVNPHKKGTRDHKWYQDGYRQAKDDVESERKFEMRKEDLDEEVLDEDLYDQIQRKTKILNKMRATHNADKNHPEAVQRKKDIQKMIHHIAKLNDADYKGMQARGFSNRASLYDSVELIDAIAEGDTIKSSELFSSALMSKVSSLIEERRQEVAQSMCNEAIELDETSDIENEVQHWKDQALHWSRKGHEKFRLKSLSNLKIAQAKLQKESVELDEATYVVTHNGHSNPVGDYSHFPKGKTYINHVTKYENSATKTAKMLKDKGFNSVYIMKNGRRIHQNEAVETNESKTFNDSEYLGQTNFGKFKEKNKEHDFHYDPKEQITTIHMKKDGKHISTFNHRTGEIFWDKHSD